MGTKIKAFHLISLFLCFSFLLSTVAAVPSSRSMINPNKHDPSAPFILSQGKVELRENGVEEGRKIEGRMEIELTDYPGTGANNNHDPRNPGNSG